VTLYGKNKFIYFEKREKSYEKKSRIFLGFLVILGLLMLPPTVFAYCSSSGATYNEEYIIKAELNTGIKSSSFNGYSDYSASVLTTLNSGQTYTIKVTGQTLGGWTEYVKAWIDYNNNGVFTDSGEEINLVSHTFPSGGGSYIYSMSFTVPSSVSTGNKKMRISLKYNSAPSSCESFAYGEVEDYTINIASSGNNYEVAQVNVSSMPWSGYYWPMLDKNVTGSPKDSHNLYENGGPLQDYDTYTANLGVSSSPVNVESPHPYTIDYDNTWPITISGATKIRAHITRYDLEGHYDFLKILDGSNNQITDYSGGYGEHNVYDVWTPWVNGDTIKIRLATDYSVNYWGFNVDMVQYVTNGNVPNDSSAQAFENYNHVTYNISNWWWGHCDAWSAASILENEPITTSTINGVTFDRNDKKGLLTEKYMSFNKEFWDINLNSAKLFHDTLIEYIKTKGKPIIVDIYQDGAQDWNHPVYKYEMNWITSGSRTDYITTIWYKTDAWSSDGSGTADSSLTYKYYINSDGTSQFTTNNDPHSYPDYVFIPISRVESSRENIYVNYDVVKTIIKGG
jgi:hypothetical protein